VIGRLANALFGGAGAIGLGQAPAFYEQYLQRMAGRLDQARAGVDRVRQDAEARGESLDDYIGLSLTDTSERAREAGQRALEAVETRDRLEASYASLSEASVLERPIAFVETFEPDLAEATMRAFAPGLPLSAEALVYAGIGMLIGLALLSGLEGSGRALVRSPSGRGRGRGGRRL
jgi:hypothetical protein